jgi:hypothetical protein
LKKLDDEKITKSQGTKEMRERVFSYLLQNEKEGTRKS